jgi:pepF/M3 family oligoendopeptidase
MMNIWNLDDLYKGFDDAYLSDLKKMEEIVDLYIHHIQHGLKDDISYIEGYLKLSEAMTRLARGLFSYPSLVMSTDVMNQEALGYMSKLQNIMRKSTKENVIFSRFLTNVDLSDLRKKSALIDQYFYQLHLEQEDAKYLLSEKEEVLYAKLRDVASSSWSQLQSLVTANLNVFYRDQKLTLSQVRNLASDSDPSVRKDAFDAELKAYLEIEDVIALALSNIKREVTILNELRGYESALDKTLLQSKLSKQTLDAMISSMMDFRPHFSKYLKAKAKYLGHQNGLPFYDLFAPVGKLETSYSYEASKQLVLDAFGGYDESLYLFAKKAFDQNWLDVEPRKGKRGGAFCSNQPQIKQSRIMLNHTGSLNNVSTMAHELGHGYHGEIISENNPLHWSYPMPLAETASIFCETILNDHMLSKITDKKERLSVLESSLQGDTQVIIDILSRYFFETELFKKAQGPISKDFMKTEMIKAQKEAYLDGLDHHTLHPFMWINKPHYYSAGLNFYNFPYAFGLLFGKGLYAQYLKDKKGFVSKYKDLLSLTTKASVEDCAKSMGIDVTSKDFWYDSLNEIKKDIDEVIELLKN